MSSLEVPTQSSDTQQVSDATLCSFQYILQECTRARDSTLGKSIYSLIVATGLESNPLLGTHLIQLFAAVRSLVDIQKVFRLVAEPNGFMWAVVISAHVKLGQKQLAIQLFEEMQLSTLKPDGYVFVAVLGACTEESTLMSGRLTHLYIVEAICEPDLFVTNALINMYSKCGSCEDAHAVFSKSAKRDIVTWSAIMSAYVEQGSGQEALESFQQFVANGYEADRVIFLTVLRSCSMLAYLNQGFLAHSYLVEKKLDSNNAINNSLIDMYVKCGSLNDAKNAFHSLSERDVVAWNALLGGHSMHEKGYMILLLFETVLQQSLCPNQATFIIMLKCCADAGLLHWGQKLHVIVRDTKLGLDAEIGTSLINMYAKCGKVQDAFRVCESLPRKSLVTWNSLLAGCCSQACHAKKAMEVFNQMLQNGLQVDACSFVTVLKICSSVHLGDSLLHCTFVIALALTTSVSNAFLDMYLKCGGLHHARWTFNRMKGQRDVTTWSLMISGCITSGVDSEGIELYHAMQKEGLEPDTATIVCILKALSTDAKMEMGALLHAHAVQISLDSDLMVRNTLIDMYAKSGSLRDARWVFDWSAERSVVSWNAIIAGCVDHSLHAEAHELYVRMADTCVEPNEITYSCILKACSQALELGQGKLYHQSVVEKGFSLDLFLMNAILDMYTTCGSFWDACTVFKMSGSRDLISWNSLISGSVVGGCPHEALPLFQQLLQAGMKPDEITFVVVLKACTCTKFLDQGKMIHNYIIECYYDSDSIVANTLVVMYTQCGSLLDACFLLDKHPNQDVYTWGALVGGCAHHSHYTFAWECFKTMQQRGVKPNDVIFGSLLSVCSHMGLTDEAFSTLKLIGKGNALVPYCSHYTSMIDLLGRVGYLDQAEDLLECMPLAPPIPGSMSLLSHTRTHGNIELPCFDGEHPSKPD